jgi:hypothetical protein
MAQFVDFVGLNTFIYEINGYIPDYLGESILGPVSFFEFVKNQNTAIAGYPDRYAFSVPQTIGTFLFGGGLPGETSRFRGATKFLQNEGFPLHLSASIHGIPSSASYFPALMLKRNGPYGHPMFKQIRVHENPLTRRQIKENIFTIVETPSQEIIRTYNNNKIQTIRSRYGGIVGYREAMITSRYQPVDWLLGFSSDEERILNADNPSEDNIERLILRNSFGNDINFFAHADLNNRLGLEIEEDEDYERISNFYLNGGLDSDESPASTFEFLKYRETVFPRETNAFRAISRKRTNYKNNFWRDDREDRSGLFTSSIEQDSFGNQFQNVISPPADNTDEFKPSIWPLDASTFFEISLISTLTQDNFLGFNSNSGIGEVKGAGVLQNQYSIITNTAYDNYKNQNLEDFFRAAPTYNRRHTLAPQTLAIKGFADCFNRSVVSPDGIEIDETGSTTSGLAIGGVGTIGQGTALWEAGTQAGKNPFYSSYDYWWEQLRLKAKDYSVVPEFRISEFIETIEKSGSQTFIDNMLEVTGGSSGEVDLFDPSAFFFGNDSSETKFYETYSTSDFMKHFAKIKKDHDEFVEPSKITLTCKAFKKFLAYDSFYPALRTVDLATQFSRSYSDNITGYDINTSEEYKQNQVSFQQFLKPLMSPGILFNSIKSGIACDYPNMKQNLQDVYYLTGANSSNSLFNATGALSDGSFQIAGGGGSSIRKIDNRIPFEAIYNPDKYLVDNSILDFDANVYGSLMSVSASWNGEGDNLYKKMVNNFLAETVSFFLEDSELSFLSSRKQSDANFGIMEAGKTYGMRIKIGKTYSTAKKKFSITSGSYFPPNNYIEGDDFAKENITMYSRPSAFGPALAGPAQQDDSFHQDQLSINGSSSLMAYGSMIGYNFPYTPPYYYGDAWCDILFDATTSKKYTLPEILQGAEYYLCRVDPESYASSSVNIVGAAQVNAPSNGYQGTGSVEDSNASVDGYVGNKGTYQDLFIQDFQAPSFVKTPKSLDSSVSFNAMPIISSLNIDKSGLITEKGGNVVVTLSEGDPDEQWIIQPKWETPILNFKDVSVTIPGNSSGDTYSAQVPRGMWHQYGRIPEPNESIFMQVSDIPLDWNQHFIGAVSASYTGSLADVCGFSRDKVRLGKIESKKIIKEAVVAVPYIQRANRKEFYSIGADQVYNAKKYIDLVLKTSPDEIQTDRNGPDFYSSRTTSVVINMVRKMDEFVFPPTMDFVHYPDKVKPFAMYIFEFSHELNQQDLADIWQNLPPRLGEGFEEAEATISHPLFSNHFLSSIQREEGQQTPAGGTINTEIRWMVFKVKQRAETAYESKTITGKAESIKTRKLFPPTLEEERIVKDQLLSYNWPYDYFSLVELVKLDAEVTFSDIQPDNPTAIQNKGNAGKNKAKINTDSIERPPARRASTPSAPAGAGSATQTQVDLSEAREQAAGQRSRSERIDPFAPAGVKGGSTADGETKQ